MMWNLVIRRNEYWQLYRLYFLYVLAIMLFGGEFLTYLLPSYLGTMS